MKIFTMIPSWMLLKAHEKKEINFSAHCTLAEDSTGKLVLIITQRDETGKPINGVQFIADLDESQDAATREGAVKRQNNIVSESCNAVSVTDNATKTRERNIAFR